MEIWKNIENYENYQVSNLGRVKRKAGYQSKTERILSSINNGNDYLSFCLCKNGKAKRFYAHRLVALAFIENKENKEEVNHIDGIRTNNKLTNLEWVTRSENHLHRYIVLKQRGVNFGKTGAKNWKSKPVLKYTKEMKFLKEYAGVMEAQRQTKISESNIRNCIYGNSKTAGGFIWFYK
jgi:hypothetical protein